MSHDTRQVAKKPSSFHLACFIPSYAIIDKIPSGEITAQELGNVMRQLGLKPSETELEDIMNEIDSDHSGTIDFNGILLPEL